MTINLNAEPRAVGYKNQGEYGYQLGVAVFDENGDTLEVPAGVNFIYYDTLGVKQTVPGSNFENIAYYDVLITNFTIPGTYRYWLECFTLDRFGPFELIVLKV